MLLYLTTIIYDTPLQEVTEVKPDIDFVATLSNICRVQLTAILSMIMQTRGMSI